MKNKESFEYNFTLDFRSKLYERCKILVNDMTPVIKEVDLFIKNVMLSPLKGDSKTTYRILGIVDLYVERTNETIREYKWTICTNQHVDHILIELDYESIKEMFGPFNDTFIETLKENDIYDFPNILLTKAFLCFIETIGYYLSSKDISGEHNIYNIFRIANNGECNILI